MIEVIVSITIISFVLLSLLIYQIACYKNIYRVELKTIAIIQLINFSEILRVTINSERDRALSQWNTENYHLLPGGKGSFEQRNHVCQIGIQWFSGKSESEVMDVYCP